MNQEPVSTRSPSAGGNGAANPLANEVGRVRPHHRPEAHFGLERVAEAIRLDLRDCRVDEVRIQGRSTYTLPSTGEIVCSFMGAESSAAALTPTSFSTILSKKRWGDAEDRRLG